MKEAKSDLKQEKHNAEFWVNRAKAFGEKCVAIQQDPKLSNEQKLDKQRALSNEIAKEVQNDTNLKAEDKKKMLDSIKNYLNDWQKIHKSIQEDEANQQKQTKKQSTSTKKH